MFQNFSGMEKFYGWKMRRGGGGASHFSVENFLAHSADTLLTETLLCFRKFLVSKNFMAEREGEYDDSPSKLFCLTVPKHFLEKFFCVSENFWHPNVFMIKKKGRGRECTDFPSKLICLTVTKHFVEEPFCVSESFRYRKVLWIGEYHDFLSKNHSTEKSS